MRCRLASSFAGLALLAGCAATFHQVPDLGGLYDRAAAVDDSLRNPVIVIPGVLGSKLHAHETGATMWGAFGGGYANPSTPDGRG